MRLGCEEERTSAAIDCEEELREPFCLKVTCTTKGDLIALWGRFNMSGAVLSEAAAQAAADGKKGEFSDEFVEALEYDPPGKKEIWKFLDGKLKENGINRR